MSGLLSVLGFVALVVAVVGVGKGSLRSLGLHSRRQCAGAAGAAFVVMLVGGSLAPEPPPRVEPPTQVAAERAPASPSAEATAAPRATAAPTPVAPSPAPEAAAPEPVVATSPAAEPLLVMAAGGDGDSWRDTGGVEYRMGLINTPETDECGGAAATAYRQRALADGFRVQVYATDDYGRQVAVVLAANGVNLNVAMARDGIADDRYLERFRHENPTLARQLDAAFAEARAAGRGIWRTCSAPAEGAATPPPQPIAGGRCHPDYATCIPVVGDGSGRGAANDLDCSDLDEPVRLREIGRDPYRLDGRDQDGVGCE